MLILKIAGQGANVKGGLENYIAIYNEIGLSKDLISGKTLTWRYIVVAPSRISVSTI